MPRRPRQLKLSHLSADGSARMVDVSGKAVTVREARASAAVRMRPAVLRALLADELPKGDALAAARLAGVLAAKRTAEWIPLCHPLPLDWVHLEFARAASGTLEITCTARTTARTGVEMEALVGVSAAALTIYDMAKAADKGIVIGPIRLEYKSGGKSGTYRAPGVSAPSST
ncbi:MAG: cyclic pyranopterin monophosphate synthase MoaC [Planctomycetes bacterium]|nr:cyclic pyranopterin monophosphate synthase MoaC [Planctomycetota bacterium]